jgi:hypothetical protein
LLQTTGSVPDRKKTDDTYYHVGAGDEIHTRLQTTRKSLVLLAKQIGVSASSTRTATKLLNLHPLWFTNSAIQITK